MTFDVHLNTIKSPAIAFTSVSCVTILFTVVYCYSRRQANLSQSQSKEKLPFSKEPFAAAYNAVASWSIKKLD